MKSNPTQVLRLALVGVALVLAQGCESILGIYRGPEPSRESIVGETVIIRWVSGQPETGIQRFYVDRERYLTSAPHNINRIVEVTSRDIQPAVAEMQLKVGERVRISTTFHSFRTVGELSRYFENWPHDKKYHEYPIGFHVLTSVERVAP
ncbi:MAG TPA: hypothetical protein VGR37_15550 [Longimicrobiaceae bacterium]|nr:hypothetical protein [Longimicrobiaceae bacterium]